MSTLHSFKRHLSRKHVWLAEETQRQKIALAKKFVEERAGKDVEFAKDILKVIGVNLPDEIRKVAEDTVEAENNPSTMPSLPEDPLLTMKAQPEDYPENQGIGPAISRAMEKELLPEATKK